MDFNEKLLEFSDRVLSKSLNDQEKNNYTETIFESIKHINKYGQEFWFARELSKILEYKDYRNFLIAIDKAMETCKQSGNEIKEHFGEATNMILIGNGAHREVSDYSLSRYACYLIIMNADETKEIVALGKTYFAVNTRQQELIEQYDNLTEEQKRLAIRNEMVFHNKSLAEAARMAGISDARDYAIFQNKGYQGL